LDRVLATSLDGGTLTDEPLAYDPRSAVRLGDERLFLVDGGPRPFLLLNTAGRVEARFGEWGLGPREVNTARPATWAAVDGLIRVVDTSNRKILTVSLSDAVVGEEPMPFPADYVLDDAVVPESGEYFAHLWYVTHDSTGAMTSLGDSVRRWVPEQPDSVASIPLPRRPESEVVRRGGAALFAPRPVFAVLDGGSVATGRTDSPTLNVYHDGRLIRLLDIGLGSRASIRGGGGRGRASRVMVSHAIQLDRL
jgi:hypothetical protein